MTKRVLLIFSAMMIVFSLTLIGGGITWMQYLSPTLDDPYIHAGVFYGGALIVLVGLAGFLAGLVGVVGSAILKASEIQEELNKREEAG